MNKKAGSYHEIDFLAERREIFHSLTNMNARKHFMYGLLEVDVTVAQAVHRRRTEPSTGETLLLHRVPGPVPRPGRG